MQPQHQQHIGRQRERLAQHVLQRDRAIAPKSGLVRVGDGNGVKSVQSRQHLEAQHVERIAHQQHARPRRPSARFRRSRAACREQHRGAVHRRQRWCGRPASSRIACGGTPRRIANRRPAAASLIRSPSRRPPVNTMRGARRRIPQRQARDRVVRAAPATAARCTAPRPAPRSHPPIPSLVARRPRPARRPSATATRTISHDHQATKRSGPCGGRGGTCGGSRAEPCPQTSRGDDDLPAPARPP